MNRINGLSIGARCLILVLVSSTALVLLAGIAALQARSDLEEQRNDRTRSAVQAAIGVLEHFGKLEQDGSLSQTDAQNQAKATIKQMRYAGQEYFWINDMGPTMIMHPTKPELDNTDLSKNADPDGKLLFIEMVDVVQKDGSGFVAYQWPKPDEEDPQPKVSFVQGYAPWGWIVGSGSYVDDVQAAFREQLTSLALRAIPLLLILLGVSWLIARAITRPLKNAIDVLERDDRGSRLAVGDSNNELDRLGRALNRTLDRVTGAADRVAAAADSLQVSAVTLLRNSEDISRTAQTAEDEARTVVTSADRVVDGIDEVATGAGQIADSIREIATSTSAATLVATQAVAVAAATNATVAQLGESSAEISSVVKAITSIAEQTNLLALNATIEAARAGAAGKGFAVVAEEVKQLAQETARATEDISSRVEAIQSDTQQAVATIGQISAIIGQIHEYQVTIAGAVEEQTATTSDMSRTVDETAGNGRQIGGAISSVADAAARTTLGISNIRTAAEQLALTAEELQDAVRGLRT